jgi:hypothetical protein
MTLTTWSVLLIAMAGVCELTASFVAGKELVATARLVEPLRRGPLKGTPNEVLEVLTTHHESGTNMLLVQRVIEAVLERFQSNRSSRVAVMVLVPIGIALGVAGDLVAAVK